MGRHPEAGTVPIDPRRERLALHISQEARVEAYTIAYWHNGRDRVRAHDAVQQAAVSVLTRDLPEEIRDEHAFAMQVVVNEARQDLRAEFKHSGRGVEIWSDNLQLTPSYTIPEGQVDDKADLETVRRVAPTVVFAEETGYKAHEIAKQQGITLSMVKNRKHEERVALESVRERLGR